MATSVKFRRTKSEEVSVNLTPLIDVVFLLLIFFMVSTTFKTDHSISIVLPESTTENPAPTANVVLISVDKQGNIIINDVPTTKNDLTTVVRALRALKLDKSAQLVYRGDKASPMQAFVTVNNAIAEIGLNQLSLTTQQPGD